MSLRSAPQVLLMLGWYDYRLRRGIEKYAQEHGWHLSVGMVREKVIPWGWSGDGILAWLGAGDDVTEFVQRARKPTVDFSYCHPRLKFTRVLEDTDAASQLIAEHFLVRGFRRFLFYSDADNWIYNERGKGFQGTIRGAGRVGGWLSWHTSADFCDDRNAWKRKRAWLTRQLRAAAKPVGIFAASDELALELLEICENEGISVPDEVAIVGAGNSLLAVDAMHTPISSVDTNLETIGYSGACALDNLMRQKTTRPSVVRVPPAQLIVRKSSDQLAVSHAGIAKSLRFMREHCHEPIGVGEMAKAADMSRRSFHNAFVENVGRPPGAELQHIRIERVKRMLIDSDDKVLSIAEKCGYQSSNSLWVAFRNATGMGPQQFRVSRAMKRTPVVAPFYTETAA